MTPATFSGRIQLETGRASRGVNFLRPRRGREPRPESAAGSFGDKFISRGSRRIIEPWSTIIRAAALLSRSPPLTLLSLHPLAFGSRQSSCRTFLRILVFIFIFVRGGTAAA